MDGQYIRDVLTHRNAEVRGVVLHVVVYNLIDPGQDLSPIALMSAALSHGYERCHTAERYRIRRAAAVSCFANKPSCRMRWPQHKRRRSRTMGLTAIWKNLNRLW